MRQVSIRQFQRNFYKELKDVPFIVLRQVWEGEEGQKKAVDKPEFIVTAYQDPESVPASLSPSALSEPLPKSIFDTPIDQVGDKPTIGARLRKLFKKDE